MYQGSDRSLKHFFARGISRRKKVKAKEHPDVHRHFRRQNRNRGVDLGQRAQSRNHADVDSVTLRDLAQSLASGAALDGFLPLVVRELRFPPELDTLRHGALAAVARAPRPIAVLRDMFMCLSLRRSRRPSLTDPGSAS